MATRGLYTIVVVDKVLHWLDRSYFTLKSIPGCSKSNGFWPKWPFSGFLSPLKAPRSKIMSGNSADGLVLVFILNYHFNDGVRM